MVRLLMNCLFFGLLFGPVVVDGVINVLHPVSTNFTTSLIEINGFSHGDQVIENAPGVGANGGSCECPSGYIYQVGDNSDSCASLACVGGKTGTCNAYKGDWAWRKVICYRNTSGGLDRIIENAPGVGDNGGSCTCPSGAVYYVGDNFDTCGSLACVGGQSGPCNHYKGVWSRRKVICFEDDPDVDWYCGVVGTVQWWGNRATNYQVVAATKYLTEAQFTLKKLTDFSIQAILPMIGGVAGSPDYLGESRRNGDAVDMKSICEKQNPLGRYKFMGIGTCWDKFKEHGKYVALTEVDDNPESCYNACIREFGDQCSGFDTRTKCLIYSNNGYPSNAIVWTSHCELNGNQPNCNHWKNGACYAVNHPKYTCKLNVSRGCTSSIPCPPCAKCSPWIHSCYPNDDYRVI